ncbi:U4/U6.U5 snRNP associated protein [Maudiozyma exigua]|uniref:U4/U6.U5 snRNP associated protein n=1 Tax=Maudiozyma exigua TaxID=34358 RepID=A0A9P6WCV6_MAUEX|nr:U4/U6.U5 snRNP associated protein [Kazachstania exigua]
MSNFGRRTWNKEDYIGKTDTDIARQFTENELNSLKLKYSNYNELMKQTNSNMNQKTLVANVTSFKKGKQFGFYCDLCDLTFKDTLQYVDHLNHKVHLLKFESMFGESLISDLRDNDDIPMDEFKKIYSDEIKTFVKLHDDYVPKTKITSRSKKAEVPEIKEETKLSKMMGFGSFGSTKK